MPGQERFDVLDGLRLGELSEEVTKVGVGLESIRLRCFDKRIEIGAGFGPFDGRTEQPAAASESKGPDGVLRFFVGNQ